MPFSQQSFYYIPAQEARTTGYGYSQRLHTTRIRDRRINITVQGWLHRADEPWRFWSRTQGGHFSLPRPCVDLSSRNDPRGPPSIVPRFQCFIVEVTKVA